MNKRAKTKQVLNRRLIYSETLTVTNEDYYSDQFEGLRYEIGNRMIEFNDHILMSDMNHPELKGLKKGQKVKVNCYTSDDSLALEHTYEVEA